MGKNFGSALLLYKYIYIFGPVVNHISFWGLSLLKICRFSKRVLEPNLIFGGGHVGGLRRDSQIFLVFLDFWDLHPIWDSEDLGKGLFGSIGS